MANNMIRQTVTRFALKSGDKYMSEKGWTDNIWESRLFKDKPTFPTTLIVDGKMVMISISYEELPYELES